MENIIRIQKLIENDRMLTVEQISSTRNIRHGNVHKIAHDHMGFSKLSDRWVPKTLAIFDRANRVEISRKNLHRMRSDPEIYFDRIVT